jgi:hypothetical protein
MRAPRPRFALPSLCALVLCLLGCWRDGGFVEPGAEGNLPVLARFQGKAIIPGTTLSGERMGSITHPKIALVWQFIGLSARGFAFDRITVDTRSPFKFAAEFRNPPPEAIAYSEEPAIGSFWMYSDGNENDSLDRLVHPKVAARDQQLADLNEAYKTALKALLEVSDVSPTWIPYKDTFLLDSIGTFIRVVGGRKDTLFKSSGKRQQNLWNEVLFRRTRLLKNYNAWENFFALRAKTHDYYRVAVPLPDFSYLQIFEDWKKLLPKPGMEQDFEIRLRLATLAYLVFLAAVDARETDAQDSGWVDYPYQGFEQEGADWVVGKSKYNFVLYFPTRASLDRVLQAETWGSFNVEGIDDLHVGYNLLKCDAQYRCKVLASADSIFIDLGEHDSVFNPPRGAIEKPVPAFTPVDLPEDSLRALDGKFEGRYEGRANHPNLVLARAGALWADFPDKGLMRLIPGTSHAFYVPGSDLQVEFVPTVGGRIGKVMLYYGGSREVGLKVETAFDREAMGKRIDAIGALKAVRLGAGLTGSLPQRFALGKDTLSVRYAAGGDSIVLTRPDCPPVGYFPLDDTSAFDAGSEDRLAFVRNAAGQVTGMAWTRFAGTVFLPALGYHPKTPADFYPDTAAAPATPASAHGGSGLDSYVDHARHKRYACAQDGLYLRAGDGWVAGVNHGQTGDSISLRDAGDGLLFKVEGQAGKRIKLELITCGEKGGKQGGILMALHGGREAKGPFPDLLSEPDWVRPDDKGDTLTFAPIPIPSDPYYLDLRRIPTYDDSLYHAFEGYRAWSD